MKSLRAWMSLAAVGLAMIGCNNLIDAGDPQVVEEPGGDEDGDPPAAEEPFCGDGVIDAEEQCDDGNEVPSDGCHQCRLGCGPFPEALNTVNGSCYLLQLAEKRSWEAAEADCEAWGGTLAAITTLDELGFVQEHLGSDTWVGGLDPGGPGPFEWVTGEAWTLDVEDTFTTPPVAYGYDTCLLIDGDALGFRQEECNTAAGYVCERPE